MCVHKEEDSDTKQVFSPMKNRFGMKIIKHYQNSHCNWRCRISVFKVYFYLFKLLRRCILQLSKPSVEGPLGTPPYEKPSIAKGVTNFVLYKFNHLSPKEWQMMWVPNNSDKRSSRTQLWNCARYDLAKMFLHCLNHWKLETPTARKQQMSSEDVSAYKVGKIHLFQSTE